MTSSSSLLHAVNNRHIYNWHHWHPYLVGNLSTEVALLAWYQLDFTAGWWVHFSIWIRFSLYAVHVVLINQNSHHITIILLYCTLIYCCHSWLLHKDAATQFTDPTSTVFSHCILILHINNYSQAQFSKCSVRICYTVTNMAIIYICPSDKSISTSMANKMLV